MKAWLFTFILAKMRLDFGKFRPKEKLQIVLTCQKVKDVKVAKSYY